jgi:hypothetical protein
MCRSDKGPSPGTRGSLEPQSRFAEKISRSDKNLTDTDSAHGRVHPGDADQASSQENRLQKGISERNTARSQGAGK